MIYDFKVMLITVILLFCQLAITLADFIIDSSVFLNGTSYNIIYDTTNKVRLCK